MRISGSNNPKLGTCLEEQVLVKLLQTAPYFSKSYLISNALEFWMLLVLFPKKKSKIW